MAQYPIRHQKNDEKNHILGDGKISVGITLGVILTVITYLMLSFRADGVTGETYTQLAPIIISLLVAGTSTFLAANALIEQRRTREAGTDPVLLAHFGQREDARELVTFNLSNIGAGAALNVQLSVEKPIGDFEEINLLSNIFRTYRPFSVIQQNKSIEFSLAVGWELIGKNSLPPFKVNLSYEDLSGDHYESEFTLDVREMEGLSTNKSPQMRSVAALERIAAKVT